LQWQCLSVSLIREIPQWSQTKMGTRSGKITP
jgi:hypothetical protein